MENNSPSWPISHDPLSRSRFVLAVLEVAFSILICLTSIQDNLLVVYVVHNESTPKSLTNLFTDDLALTDPSMASINMPFWAQLFEGRLALIQGLILT